MSAGCDQAQGYLYGRPMLAQEFEDYLRRHFRHFGNTEAGEADLLSAEN